jgi:hypothetical protein
MDILKYRYIPYDFIEPQSLWLMIVEEKNVKGQEKKNALTFYDCCHCESIFGVASF